MYLIFYETSTGKISNVLQCPELCIEGNLLLAKPLESVLQVGSAPDSLSGGTHWVASEVIETRPIMPLVYPEGSVVEGEYFIVTGVPVGTVLHCPGGPHNIDDGSAEWASIEAGTYELRFENFPYQSETVSVQVTSL
jgi:hypothetical protein